jgi:hypothetical protein
MSKGLERINFGECVLPDGTISNKCAKRIGQYEYIVNKDKALRTHGKF